MSSTSAIDAGTTRIIDTSNKTREISNDLGKDAFLELLVTQLANQDPLEPTSDTEFIAQMANFSTLEQMQNMTTQLETQTAYDMIGKDVRANTVADSDGNTAMQAVYGRVSGVITINGTPHLQVDDYDTEFTYNVPLGAIQETSNTNDTLTQNLLAQILTQMQTMNGYMSGSAATEAYEQAAAEAGVQGPTVAEEA